MVAAVVVIAVVPFRSGGMTAQPCLKPILAQELTITSARPAGLQSDTPAPILVVVVVVVVVIIVVAVGEYVLQVLLIVVVVAAVAVVVVGVIVVVVVAVVIVAVVVALAVAQNAGFRLVPAVALVLDVGRKTLLALVLVLKLVVVLVC